MLLEVKFNVIGSKFACYWNLFLQFYIEIYRENWIHFLMLLEANLHVTGCKNQCYWKKIFMLLEANFDVTGSKF